MTAFIVGIWYGYVTHLNSVFLHCLPLFLNLLVLLQAVSSCNLAHITQYNNDQTSCPARLEQPEIIVFFPFHVGEGKPRPKQSRLCPALFSEAEHGQEDLQALEA